MIKLGVDNGNYNTKSSEGIIYASGFSVSKSPAISIENQLEYENKFYAIGEGRMSVQNDKTVDDDVFILTLPAIAHAMDKEHIQECDVMLGVGLPISMYGAQKDKFKQYFLRTNIVFAYSEKIYRINTVDCKVFPQGYAALCRYYGALSGYATLTLVDIGGYTIDIMQCRNGVPDKSSCRSLPNGTITLFNNIKNDLLAQSIMITDMQITDGLNGRVEHLRREYILETIKKRCQEYTKQLFNALSELGIDLQTPIMLAGGGAEILCDYLKIDGINTIGILDKFANAEGYKILI